MYSHFCDLWDLKNIFFHLIVLFNPYKMLHARKECDDLFHAQSKAKAKEVL